MVTPVSFEFFPPKNEASQDRLMHTADELSAYDPAFMSVTYGAGGSNRAYTEAAVSELSGRLDVPIMPHLTCVAHSEAEIDSALLRYQELGIDHILALAGDTPDDGHTYESDFSYAEELVVAIRALGDFRVGVAAHPEGHPRSATMAGDRRFLADKLSLADFAITQFFFDIETYERLMDDLDKLQVDKPVIPGILPVSSASRLYQMADMNNTSIPADLARRLEMAGEDSLEVEKLGVDVATRLSEELIAAGAPGIHLYTMNRSDLARSVLENL